MLWKSDLPLYVAKQEVIFAHLGVWVLTHLHTASDEFRFRTIFATPLNSPIPFLGDRRRIRRHDFVFPWSGILPAMPF